MALVDLLVRGSAITLLSGRHQWFARMEVVGKPAHDLHVHEFITNIFTVGKGQLGYLHRMPAFKGWAPGNLRPSS